MEFIFEDIIYKYENGWIYWKHELGYFNKLCPVLDSLKGVFDMLGEGHKIDVLEALVHAACYGYQEGKNNKITEIKRVLDIR